MLAHEPEAGTYLKCSETIVEKINNFAIVERFTNESLDDEWVLMFSRELHLQFQSCTSKEAFRLVVFVDEGSGLVAWRVLIARFQPRTRTKRADFRAILNSSSKGLDAGRQRADCPGSLPSI